MEEVALINAAQEGDVDAYNDLVRHYQNQVYNIAYRVMGEADAAADATQEAFISAYKAINSFRGGSFKAWLFRIVKNACYDELRRRKRRPQSALEALYVEDESPDDPSLATDAENPEQFAQRMELQQAIVECLQQLPDNQRTIAVMADVEGMSYDEVAGIEDVPLGTVKSRLYRARQKLKDCLQGFKELLPSEYRLDE